MGEPQYFGAIDIELHVKEPSVAQLIPITLDRTRSSAEAFLAEQVSLISTYTSTKPSCKYLRFIFSKERGYPIRDDFLERRLECCPFVSSVISFSTPRREIEAWSERDLRDKDLLEILSPAAAALDVALDGDIQVPETIKELDGELRNRLSFPWCIRERPPQKRLAFVQGREDIDSSRRFYEAAKALNIALVVLDTAGHWMEDDGSPFAQLREAFIPVSVDVDDGFVNRIVAAVRCYDQPIDSIVTISDVRLPGVAEACEILGLPTEPSTAYATAGDKGATRRLETENTSDAWFAVESAEEIQSMLLLRRETLRYPLVVKPCVGWNSDCVTKCHDEAELVAAVTRASERHANSPKRSTAVVVEPYIDGPEVDANLVLLDGEVLFFEVEDDFPSTADRECDYDQARGNANFMETQVVMPSKLPREEIDLLRESLRASILRQGFRSGVFHCEARIRNSKACYATQGEDGSLLDIQVRDPPCGEAAGGSRSSIYLLEINARPPGYIETVAVLLAYGIDYYAIRLLLALGPSESCRVRAVAQPFSNGPQFNLSLTILPSTKSGIMKTEDAVLELLSRYPELRGFVVDHRTSKKRGDYVQGPESNELWWIAYISVVSRSGRTDLLKRVEFIRKHFQYEVETTAPPLD